MNRSALLGSMILLILAGMFAVILAGRPSEQVLRHPAVVEALQAMGVTQAGWQTVVVMSVRQTAAPREAVYAQWQKLEEWPTWAKPLVAETLWIDRPGWREGARFQQTLDLGIPFGRIRSVETVSAARPGALVAWRKDEGGHRSIHVWRFEDQPGGETRIINLEIFHGPGYGLLRAIIESDWQRRFDLAVEGLIDRVRTR